MNIKEKVKYVGMKNMWKQKQGQGKREEVAFLPFGSEQKKERFFFFKFNRIHTYEIPLQTQNYGEIHSSTVFTI